jgi:3-methyladenine DNA glycosylase/8-oxoguanine DNA glycosylase
VPRGACIVRITASAKKLHVEAVAGTVGAQLHEALAGAVAHMFRLDEDLSDFYALVRDDELSWCATGARRMLRVFEDVVKTICTSI